MKQYILNGKNSLGQVDSHIEDYRTKEIMEERFSRNKRNIKRTKKGAGATVKLVGIQIDNDLLPFLNALPNKSRFINDLLRKKFFGK